MTSTFSALLIGARPKTLGAALVPVLTGIMLADKVGPVNGGHALVCALFALFLQIATNYANDYYDFIKGADTAQRIGPTRMVAGGLLSPAAARNAFVAALLIACALGCFLVGVRGPELVLIGAVSCAFAVLYTGGPFPLAYLGLGDLFVVIFFGWVATLGTFYVLTGEVSFPVFILGTALGLLAVTLLVVNNIRDERTDRIANKKTLVVRWGKAFGISEYRACVIGAALLYVWGGFEIQEILSGLVTAVALLFFGLRTSSLLTKAADGAAYNLLLAGTAKVLLAVPMLFLLLSMLS